VIRRYLLPLLALAGIAVAIDTVLVGTKESPAAQPVAPPAQPPFASFVAGAGIIEASTENIEVGTPVPGLVTEVFVKAADHVNAGDPLFKLDTRDLEANLAVHEATVKEAAEKLDRLIHLPRPEELPPAEARVKAAELNLADLQKQLSMYESVNDQRAISQEELSRRRFAMQVAEARLAEVKTTLDLLKAGAWKPDLEIARGEVTAAQALVNAAQTEIERRTVRSPVDGEVLQVKVRAGEYAQSGALSSPLMLVGRVEPLHVRVDVDEHDAWRVSPDSPAIAYLRGNREINTPVEFVRTEPYVVPKRSLTGESTERVDTRVLQVIYRFHRGSLPVYVGQQMDVFIKAPPIDAGGAINRGRSQTRPSSNG
jgi:HlyD family secretion protein